LVGSSTADRRVSAVPFQGEAAVVGQPLRDPGLPIRLAPGFRYLRRPIAECRL